jgi:hypothetical protein
MVRSNDPMDMSAPVPTATVDRPRPWLRRAAILGLVLVGVTVVRPWGDDTLAPVPFTAPPGVASRDSDHDPAAADAVSPATGPAGTPATSLAADEIACSASSWQVVSLDRLGDWTVRSWVPAAAVRAEGPLDPAIRPITLESPDVLAVGACSPATVDAAGRGLPGGPAFVVSAWRIDLAAKRKATPVDLATRRAAGSPGAARLYRPGDPDAKASPAVSWPAGRFVLEVAPAGTGEDAIRPWFVGIVVRGSG